VARLRSRSTPLGASAFTLSAGVVLLASAFSPGSVWGHRSDPSSVGVGQIAGPSPWMRVVLVAIAVLGIAIVVSARRGRSVPPWSLALLGGSLGMATIAGVVLRGGSFIPLGQVASGVAVASAITIAVPTAATVLTRVSTPARLWLTAGVTAAAAIPIVFSVRAPSVGPAGVAASIAALVALLAMAAGAAWRDRVSPADRLDTRP